MQKLHALIVFLVSGLLCTGVVYSQMSSPKEQGGGLSWPLTSDGADPATTGQIRLANLESVCWNSAPAGTDYCWQLTAAEQMLSDTLVWANGGLQVAAASTIGFLGRARLKSPGVSQYTFGNNSAAGGATLDFATQDTLSLFDEAGTGPADLALQATGKYCLDGAACTDYIVTFGSGIGLYTAGELRMTYAPTSSLYGAFRMTDDSPLYVGNDFDYALEYDSTSGEAQFWTTDSDGIGTNGNIFTVSDGSTDVGFTGTVTASGGLGNQTGTTLPATCAQGVFFHDTDSNDCADTGGGDGALCLCKTANTWALVADI